METGNYLVVENTMTCQDYGEAPQGYHAYLGVPLRTSEGKIIGTVCSFHQQPRQFTPAEIELVKIFAERAATAIDNYQLYQYQQELNAQLRAEIQERQAAEAALYQSEEQLRQITDNLEQVFWLHTPDGTPIYLSPAFEKVWAQPRQTWFDRPDIWIDSIYPDDRERCRATFGHLADQKVEEEYRIVRPDEVVRIIRDQAFPIRDETGHIYRFARIAEDITERKQTEQERLMALSSLAEVGELTAMIVHEIRNPLTTVMMGLSTFKRLDLPAITSEQLALALDEAERLRALLAEILLYARPQALERSPLELNQLLTELLEVIQKMPSALCHQIDLITAPQPVLIQGDKDKLKQVFINLIDNACDATEDGETITWEISLDEIMQQATIQIRNGGKPIPPEILPKLTKPFYTTKPTGTGLGLAIVKRIVQAHQGEFTLTSSAETGTIAGIRLPLS